VHEVTLRNWERGEYEPKVSDLQKLAAALNTTEAALLNGPEERKFTVVLKFAKSIEETSYKMSSPKF
jgi:transcriptional regulator with XRE-family HTH domain